MQTQSMDSYWIGCSELRRSSKVSDQWYMWDRIHAMAVVASGVRRRRYVETEEPDQTMRTFTDVHLLE
jgi:hypothetical protein